MRGACLLLERSFERHHGHVSIQGRTIVGVGVAAQEAVEAAFAVAAAAGDPSQDLLTFARLLRRAALTLEDRAVLTAHAQGATWEEIARTLGMDTERAQARYQIVYDTWLIAHLEPDERAHSPGTAHDSDPTVTGRALDDWFRGHNVSTSFEIQNVR